MKEFFTILSLVALLVGLAARGLISPQMTAACLFLLVVLLAIGKGMGTGLVGTVFRVGIPLLSIIGLAIHYGGGDPDAAANIVAQLFRLGLILFGVYLIVSGPFRR